MSGGMSDDYSVDSLGDADDEVFGFFWQIFFADASWATRMIVLGLITLASAGWFFRAHVMKYVPYHAPATFTVSQTSALGALDKSINRTRNVPLIVDGTLDVICITPASCGISFAVKPFDDSGNAKLVAATWEYWHAVFEDPRFVAGSISAFEEVHPDSPLVKLYKLTCTRTQVAALQWTAKTKPDLRSVCLYQPGA